MLCIFNDIILESSQWVLITVLHTFSYVFVPPPVVGISANLQVGQLEETKMNRLDLR